MESQGVSLLTRVQFQYGYIGDENDNSFNGSFSYQGVDNWWNDSDDDDEINPELHLNQLLALENQLL